MGNISSRCALSTRRGLPGCPPSHSPSRPSPVPPLYQKPAPDAVVSNAGRHCWCTQVAGVRWYRIRWRPKRISTPRCSMKADWTAYLSVAQLPVGGYFWRAASVRELPGGGVDQGPFAAPQLQAGATTTGTVGTSPASQAVEHHGEPALARASRPARYRLQLAREMLKSPCWTPFWTSPDKAASDLAAGTYFLRVQVLDPSGLQGDFSPPRSHPGGHGLQHRLGIARI